MDNKTNDEDLKNKEMKFSDMDKFIEEKEKEGKTEFEAYKELMKTLTKNGFIE